MTDPDLSMNRRAYAVLTLKTVSEDERIIEGIATTPMADVVGDIVEPAGAVFSLPLPLLHQHDQNRPIGHVIDAKVTAAGILIKARIAKVTDPGTLRDRLDDVWHSIRAGLIGGLSIGFRGLEASPVKGGPLGALRFHKWAWSELSAVVLPANSQATITTIKAFDLHCPSIQTEAPAARPPIRLITERPLMKSIPELRSELQAREDASRNPWFPGQAHGLAAVRVLRSLAIAKNDSVSAEAYVSEMRWPGHDRIADYIRKAGVATQDRQSSGPISPVGADLMTALHPLTLLGRLPALRRLPSAVELLTQSQPFVAYWTAEGKPIPVSGGAFNRKRLELLKVGAIAVTSNELLRNSMVSVEQGILSDLLRACQQAIDAAFISIANAGVADQKPASITSGVTPVVVAGNTPAQIDAAMTAAAVQLLAAGNTLTSAAWVLSQKLALKMSMLRGSGGQLSYPDLTALGGTLAGLPALTTAGADEGTIVLLDANEVGYATGEPNLRASTAGVVDMNSQPGQTSMITPTSLFQAEATGLLVSVPLDWIARRLAAVPVTGITL